MFIIVKRLRTISFLENNLWLFYLINLVIFVFIPLICFYLGWSMPAEIDPNLKDQLQSMEEVLDERLKRLESPDKANQQYYVLELMGEAQESRPVEILASVSVSLAAGLLFYKLLGYLM